MIRNSILIALAILGSTAMAPRARALAPTPQVSGTASTVALSKKTHVFEGEKGKLVLFSKDKTQDFTVSIMGEGAQVYGTTKFRGAAGAEHRICVQGDHAGSYPLVVRYSGGHVQLFKAAVNVVAVKSCELKTDGDSRMGYPVAPGGIPLGIGQDEPRGAGSKTNNIEIIFTFCGVNACSDIDIKRTKHRKTYDENGNVLTDTGPNADDDSTDDDEINTPNSDGEVSVIDAPGFNPPAPGTPECQVRTYISNFREFVCVDGKEVPFAWCEWHSKLTVKNVSGVWTCVPGSGDSLGGGHTTLPCP